MPDAPNNALRVAARAIIDLGLKRLPFLPTRHRVRMMAKAATAVYEAAVENYRPQEQ